MPPLVTKRKVLVWVWRATPEGPRVLLLQRAPPWPPDWHPVTGHVDGFETLTRAAAREATEETGCVGAVEDLRYRHEFVARWKDTDYLYQEHAFALEAASDACTLSHEHQAAAWVPLDEAARRLRFPEQREALARLAARLADGQRDA